jgi:hypothetical protein
MEAFSICSAIFVIFEVLSQVMVKSESRRPYLSSKLTKTSTRFSPRS